MKIFLTGASGNLGRALQNAGKDHAWLTLDRGDWGKLQSGLEQSDVVIHAASDLITPVWKDASGVIDSNLGTTVRLLEAMSKKPSARLIFISSCAVYGRSSITSEDTPVAPISLNGIIKLANEEMIRQFAGHHRIPYTILRVFNTYGGSDRFSVLSHLKNALKNEKPFRLINGGRSQRDFIHVDDAARIVLRFAEAEKVSWPVFNVGSGETMRIADIVNVFREKYPKLKVVEENRDEAEYSRADLGRLNGFLGPFHHRQVLDFIRKEL